MDDADDFYLTPDEDELEWESDSPLQLARDLAAISLLEQNLTPLPVDFLILPNDIISQIFYHACLPIPGDKEWRRSFYPLWLGKICRAWRDIAWEASELWATVVVRAFRPDEYTHNDTAQVELLQEWLGRAKGRKLNIYLSEARDNKRATALAPLLGTIIGCSKQWQDVHFDLHTAWWDRDIFTRACARTVRTPPEDVPDGADVTIPAQISRPGVLSLPYLRSMVIQQSEGFSASYAFSMLNMDLAPSLRSIGLLNLPPNIIDNIATHFPCAQITDLTLKVSVAAVCELHTLLHHLPRLRSLFLFGTSQLQMRRGTTHPKIRSLTIHADEWGGYPSFGRFFKLPALESLEIVHSGRIQFMRFIFPFIRQSECNLTSLTIECLLVVEYELIDFLASLYTLKELHIRDAEASNQRYEHVEPNARGLGRTLFDVLHPDEFAPFLPNLEVFSYKGPLAVQAIDFLEPFILRSRMRGAQTADNDTCKIALLKQAAITADQYSELAEFSIAEYSDPRYIWEIVRMVEEGVLVLRNMDGTRWS